MFFFLIFILPSFPFLSSFRSFSDLFWEFKFSPKWSYGPHPHFFSFIIFSLLMREWRTLLPSLVHDPNFRGHVWVSKGNHVTSNLQVVVSTIGGTCRAISCWSYYHLSVVWTFFRQTGNERLNKVTDILQKFPVNVSFWISRLVPMLTLGEVTERWNGTHLNFIQNFKQLIPEWCHYFVWESQTISPICVLNGHGFSYGFPWFRCCSMIRIFSKHG